MAFLVRVAAAVSLVAGCYSPDLKNCTVSCESSADCAGAQVCSSDHYCAAKGTTCASSLAADDAAVGDGEMPGDGAAHDAGPRDAGPVDARMVDAAPPIDAPAPLVDLHLHVDGKGALSFVGGTCSDDCHYQVIASVPFTITAFPGNNQRFDRWTQGPCNGSHATTCTVTPTAPLTVAARFRKDD